MNISGISLPKIDEDCVIDSKMARQKLTEVLDLIESRVEKLRKEASILEEEKDSLLASLDTVRHADTMTDLSECNTIDQFNREKCLFSDVSFMLQLNEKKRCV